MKEVSPHTPEGHAAAPRATARRRTKPPVIIVDEDEGLVPYTIRITVYAPEQDQTFQAEADGHVALDLQGTITIEHMTEDERTEEAPEDLYEWIVDNAGPAVFTGPKGTVRLRLAAGAHTVSLRRGPEGPQANVPIHVGGSEDFFSRLIEGLARFFRRLFGG